MKTYLLYALLGAVFCIGVAGTAAVLRPAEVPERYAVTEPLLQTVLPEQAFSAAAIPPFVGNSFHGFKEALGFAESQGDYFAVNRFGYLGKYQFGAATLKRLGILDVQCFLQTPELQEKAFIASLERNKGELQAYIERLHQKHIGGVLITESGILAAAHLAGVENVKRYLQSFGLQGFTDANGTSVGYYMKKFSGYNLSFITPNKEARL